MKLFNSLLILLFLFTLSPKETMAQNSGDPVFTGEIGVQLYTYRNVIPEKGLETTLNIIKESGMTQIESGVADGVTLEQYKALLDARGITLPSYSTGYEDIVNNLDEVIKNAKFMGAEYVMVPWIPHEVGSFNFINASQAVEDFNKAGKILAENGLILQYHFHGYEIVPHKDGSLLDYIVENTHPDYVSFQMDVYWIQFGGENPERLLRKYPNRWKSFHLKDMEKGTYKDHTGLSDHNTNVILGHGEIDFEGILKTANELGIDLFFLEDESDHLLTQVPLSIKYLKSLKY